MGDGGPVIVDAPLVHLITGVEWRAALAAGSVTPPSLLIEGFIHLSLPQQVAVPANRLFAGRDDVLLLVVAPDRLGGEVRWEPGAPTDPTSMRFPHLYGPLPAAAVTSVMPYRPAPGGAYRAPEALPATADPGARAMAFDRSLVERRAAALVPVTGGVAALDPRVRHSHEHNSLWLTGDVAAATIIADADRVLAGCEHRRVVLDRPPPAELGWDVQELRVMVLDPGAPTPSGPPGVRVVPVVHEVAARLWEPMWRRDLPGVTDEVLEHLHRREGIADAHLQIVNLAVLDDLEEASVPLASAQLRVDGATAAIEAVMTAPQARRHGYGHAVVGDAIRRAREARCDVVFLVAAADDWPRGWYERLGFADIGGRWEATRVMAP
ncbi:MAG: hypothetical protein JWL83_1281 [Actinomycetia bacterium]|nr:hypothetical protein [Actinomycetes bacterium]